MSAIILPIANDEVAPGEGAFRQCITRCWTTLFLFEFPSFFGPLSNMNSPTKSPSEFIAWARTPAGPRRISEAVTDGTNFCSSLTEIVRRELIIKGDMFQENYNS